MNYSEHVINNLIDVNDKQIIDICLLNKCSIFGGYIRDIIAGISPSDIDILVPSKCCNNLIEQLKCLGYEFEGDIDDIYEPNIISCKHVYLRELDLHLCEKTSYLSSWLSPDININSLAICLSKSQGLIMYNWYIARDEDLDNPNLIINKYSNIIVSVINREMKIIHNDEDLDENRLTKYKNKGYKIL